MAKNTCWGIDVGQCALKAVKLRLTGGEVEAVSFDVIEHAKILSQPDADEQQLIRNALDKFLSRNDVKNDIVVVGVPGQASFSRFIKLPPVELRKVPEIVKYEARQQIPFNLDEVIWDYQTMTMPSGGPAEIEVGIFAMKRDIVQDYVNDFTQVRITPDAVQMGPVSLYNYLQFDRQDGAGATLLVDVGAENTSLVIADGYRVWIRNFPLGGNSFTQALVKSFKLTFSKAENLKRHAAESKHAREVFQAMRPVFSDLLTEIQRSIGFYTSLHRESRIERVLAMGNTFRLAGLQKFLSQNLGVEVNPVARFNSLKGDQVTGAPVFKENTLSFGVAYGLALQGLGLGTINTSLLPPEILKEKAIRRKRPFVMAAAAAVVVGFALLAHGAMQRSTAMIDVTTSSLGSVDSPTKDGVLAKVDALRKENSEAQRSFDEQRQKLVATQQNIDDYLALVDAPAAYKGPGAVKDADGKPIAASALPPRAFWYQVMSDLWEVLPTDPNMIALEPQKPEDHARWPQIQAIELLSVEGRFVLADKSGAPVTSGAKPALGSEGNIARTMVITVEGTMPGVGNRDPAQFLDEVFKNKMKDMGLGYTFHALGQPQPYASASAAKYPYEQEDPLLKLQQEEEKAKAAATEGAAVGRERTRDREKEDDPALRRPYRGKDLWFKFQVTVNLDDPKTSIDVVAPGGTEGFGPDGGMNGEMFVDPYRDGGGPPPPM